MNIETQNKVDLAECFIPGTSSEKRYSIQQAKDVLELAKKQNRPIRFAKSSECEFSHEIDKIRNKVYDKTLNTKDAASLLKVSEQLLRNMKAKEKIEYTKKGKELFFDRDYLLKTFAKEYKLNMDSDKNNDQNTVGLYRTAQVSRMLNIDHDNLLQHKKNGNINAIKVKNKLYFSLEDIELFRKKVVRKKTNK